jgi:hypothetical protein
MRTSKVGGSRRTTNGGREPGEEILPKSQKVWQLLGSSVVTTLAAPLATDDGLANPLRVLAVNKLLNGTRRARKQAGS